MMTEGNITATVEKTRIESGLNLDNLGAGYSIEEKRVARAVKYYENELLPFIKENHDLFKSSNFLSIKGYATDLNKESKSRRASLDGKSKSDDEVEDSHRYKKKRGT